MRPRGVIAVAVVAFVGIVAIAAVATRSTDASSAPAGPVLFFRIDDDGARGYALADPASGRIDRLTPAGIEVLNGSVAADGSWAALACDPTSRRSSDDTARNTAMCRVDLGTGDVDVVVDTGVPVQHPTVSPNGEQIVFAAGAGADRGLKITPAAGGPVASLCDGFCPLFRFSDIAWSPDGSQIAFVASTPGSGGHLPQIYTVTVGGHDYRRLTDTHGVNADPAWSPDGTRIAFSSGRSGDTELWLMDADGSDQVRLTTRRGTDIEPAWSPAGDRIVFTRRVAGSWDLAIVPIVGGEPTPLTALPGSEVGAVWLAADR